MVVIFTLIDAELLQPPPAIVTVYVPLLLAVTLGIDGFCKVEVNPLGPVHNHEFPIEDVSVVELPVQTDVVPEILATGVEPTVTVADDLEEHPPEYVTVTV